MSRFVGVLLHALLTEPVPPEAFKILASDWLDYIF